MYARSTSLQARASSMDAGIWTCPRTKYCPTVQAMAGLRRPVDDGRPQVRAGASSPAPGNRRTRCGPAMRPIAPLRERAGKLLGGSPVRRGMGDRRSCTATTIRTRAPAFASSGCTATADRRRSTAASTCSRMATLPTLERFDGFCSASLFVDRMSGCGAVTSATYDSRQAMEASRDAAMQLRKQAARDAGRRHPGRRRVRPAGRPPAGAGDGLSATVGSAAFNATPQQQVEGDGQTAAQTAQPATAQRSTAAGRSRGRCPRPAPANGRQPGPAGPPAGRPTAAPPRCSGRPAARYGRRSRCRPASRQILASRGATTSAQRARRPAASGTRSITSRHHHAGEPGAAGEHRERHRHRRQFEGESIGSRQDAEQNGHRDHRERSQRSRCPRRRSSPATGLPARARRADRLGGGSPTARCARSCRQPGAACTVPSDRHRPGTGDRAPGSSTGIE